MSAEHASAKGMRRLQSSLASAWAVAWILGVGLLAGLAINLNGKLQTQELDTELALWATATYGLTWFDEAGQFHDELLKLEDDFPEVTVDIWVIEPGSPPLRHLAPQSPRFQLSNLDSIAAQVVAKESELELEGIDERKQSYRLHSIPTYREDDPETAIAAILIVGNANIGMEAHAAFTTQLALLALGLGVLGLGVGIGLARWSVRPLLSVLEQRERFLAAAAHELRTPVASLCAVSESALANDEPAETALARVHSLAQRTAQIVDDLLVFARLDAGDATLEPEKVRLDLLVEDCVANRSGIRLEAEESVVSADTRLLRVAIRNLIENAELHGRTADSDIYVSVRGAVVTVEDCGPGFPEELLKLAQRPFSGAPSARGAGLGLATVSMIAKLQGGSLILQNRPEGGARAVLRLSASN